jgi:hypothetical protein
MQNLTRSGLRGLDEGCPFDALHIGIAFGYVSGKSEAGHMKSDMGKATRSTMMKIPFANKSLR